jgi:hypothetical protein
VTHSLSIEHDDVSPVSKSEEVHSKYHNIGLYHPARRDATLRGIFRTLFCRIEEVMVLPGGIFSRKLLARRNPGSICCLARIIHEPELSWTECVIQTRSASEGNAATCPRLRFGLVWIPE